MGISVGTLGRNTLDLKKIGSLDLKRINLLHPVTSRPLKSHDPKRTRCQNQRKSPIKTGRTHPGGANICYGSVSAYRAFWLRSYCGVYSPWTTHLTTITLWLTRNKEVPIIRMVHWLSREVIGNTKA